VKRAVVGVLGIALLVLGVALLVLPGPGFLLIAGAFALLSTQFRWAKKPFDYAKDKAEIGIQEVAGSKLRASFAVLCALVLVGIGVVDLAGVHIPWVNRISAVLLILSGLFLVGTMIYALRQARQSTEDEPAAG
jgi:uncharacterized protein (TIGR02611 family)